MTVEIDPSARMQLRGRGDGLMHPASCMVCGNGNCEQGYVDTGVNFDYEGQMYLCVLCVSQAAETAGMLGIELSRFLREQNESLAEKNAQVTELLRKTNDELEHYRALFPSPVAADVSSVVDPATSESSEDSEQRSSGTVSIGELEESSVSEPVKDSGLSELDEPEQRHGFSI